MIDHIRLKFRTESLKHDEIMPRLPKAIRSAIAQHLFLPTLESAYLFHGTSHRFLIQLVTEMKAEYFSPREDIILQNEAPTEFYIVVSGTVDLYTCNHSIEELAGVAKAGDAVGEIGVLCFRRQPFTIRTKNLSQLLRVNRASFMNIVQANIKDGQIMVDNLFQHLKVSKSPRLLEIAKEIEEAIALGKAGSILSLRYAASVGNNELMLHLLMQGMDPNTPDHCGRTPLHVAAANGHLECTRTLLDYGADPNMQDNEGSVPLWEAIKAHHGLVAELLWENKATLNCKVEGELLCNAVQNIEVLEDLIKYGADINSTRSDGLSLDKQLPQAISVLESKGAKVDLPNGLTTHLRDPFLSINYSSPCQSLDRHSQFKDEQNPNVASYHSQDNRNGFPGLRHRSSNFFGNGNEVMNFEESLFKVVSTPLSHNTSCYEASYPKRVTIFRHHPASQEPAKGGGKLIAVPRSFEELMKIAGQKLVMKPEKVFSADSAEIDDLSVVRDNDKLFFVDQQELLSTKNV